MTEQLTEITRPKAEGYRNGRKIYLVPTFFVMAGIPDDFRERVDRYWVDVRNQVENLEKTLTRVSHVYHESVFDSGEKGLGEVEQVNAHGHAFINVLCRSTATLEATDDQESLAEAIDWQRCAGVGLVSDGVSETVREALDKATKARYSHMATVIDDTLGEDEAGLFVVNEDHQVQFPSDVQVFYVSPPSLDEIKRWVGDQMRQMIAQQEEALRQAEEAADLIDADDEPPPKEASESGEGKHSEYPY